MQIRSPSEGEMKLFPGVFFKEESQENKDLDLTLSSCPSPAGTIYPLAELNWKSKGMRVC